MTNNIFITYTGYTDLYIWLFFFIVSVIFFALSLTKLKGSKVSSILSFLITPALIWGSLGIAKLGYSQYASNITSTVVDNVTTVYETLTYAPTYEVMASTWITVIAVAYAIISLLNVFNSLVNTTDDINMRNKNPQHVITPDDSMYQVGVQKTGDVSNRAPVEEFRLNRRWKL